ncbi:hypothetical protein XSR1_70165 [Xenorhabdus szentirmaii DSM 16338]|uniref:Uncharacterized protein n=1 Tax=Xenorhabdus szentirmaii DSM 16338 TaxID=1427518 RepID=W1J3V2_9GAMM|nr:hypothetical protein XSR1_70165 [Xenorhabdus szentirmaii DSM 16338]
MSPLLRRHSVAISSPLCLFHAISESKKATVKVAFSNPNSLYYRKFYMVPRAGLEPAQPYSRGILKSILYLYLSYG